MHSNCSFIIGSNKGPTNGKKSDLSRWESNQSNVWGERENLIRLVIVLKTRNQKVIIIIIIIMKKILLYVWIVNLNNGYTCNIIEKLVDIYCHITNKKKMEKDGTAILLGGVHHYKLAKPTVIRTDDVLTSQTKAWDSGFSMKRYTSTWKCNSHQYIHSATSPLTESHIYVNKVQPLHLD